MIRTIKPRYKERQFNNCLKLALAILFAGKAHKTAFSPELSKVLWNADSGRKSRGKSDTY